MTESKQAKKGEIRGIHVLLCFVAFFGVIFSVNGVFLYSALATYTGIVSNQPYRKGIEYNERIAADVRQKELGWSEAVAFDRQGGRLVLTINDRNGAPVTGLQVAGLMGRPSTQRHDIQVRLAENRPGEYEALVGEHDDGVWLVQLEAATLRDGARETVYRLRKRLWLK
jgi:nitrogen fixation protein FixH